MTPSEPTLASLAGDLAAGRSSSRALTEACLARIHDDKGNGGNAFILVDAQNALAAASAMDTLRQAGAAPSPYAGIPISIKDLFDIAGQVTKAGSTILADAEPASKDAPAVARLRRAGFVVLGRTNMTEFAYSGLGVNPHYGTPLNPWDEQAARVPGGSSSGAGVSVARAMAHGALGTDTGGSCRIPAAFLGLAGFKPTASRVPRSGAIPLSFTLDSVGPIARSAQCCAIMDSILAGEPPETPAIPPVQGLRFVVPTTVALDALDPQVARAFERSLSRLSSQGAHIQELPFPEFGDIASMNAKGGFSAAESYAWHRRYLETQGASYDPRVRIRIERGASQTAADYLDTLAARAALVETSRARIAPYDAMLMPAVAIIPPRIADLANDSDYSRINMLALRNASIVNMIDGCALSVPMHEPDAAPAGMMIGGAAGQDRRILAIGQAVEGMLRAHA